VAIVVNGKSIETDNLIMSLFMGSNLSYTNELYDRYNLKLDKDVVKLINYIDSSNKIDKTMLQKLFSRASFKFQDIVLFNLVFNWEEISYAKSFQEFIVCLENIDENTIKKNIYYRLLRRYEGKEEQEIPKENVVINNNDVFDVLLKIEGEAEYKWYVTEVCLDIKGFISKTCEFLRECKNVLDSKLKPFNIRGEVWGEKLKVKIQEEGLTIVQSLVEDFREEDYKKIYIAPRIMDNYAFELDTTDDKKDVYMFLGENFEAINDMFGTKNEASWIQSVLNYLSDNSRFKIMTLLKEKPMIRRELAEALSLSNATVTHHTTALYLVKLIKEIKEDNKIYLTIRNESVDKFVDIFKREFNLKDIKINTNINLEQVKAEMESIEIIRSLSDASRYEITKLLSQREMFGTELATEMKLSVGTISHHIKILVTSGAINEKRVGNRIYYETNKEILSSFINEVPPTWQVASLTSHSD